ncbi:hypothetical protein [Tahibacter harae]|uniref:MoxR-vWA-beta-propeller ternary system domain-containing protein n=1 Tax=Tahibacter harae TaxID=2963937 RepID=A0ABT1QPB3_9GAMM|nr:hypothetical protein [Tahibacter harae]MCQ4164114.1 hypothetical protein [Tahibacter harae]
MNWHWQDEAAPPEPAGVLGTGAAARRLWRRAQARLESGPDGAGWQVLAHGDLLLLCGAAAGLPWVEGAVYCAPRSEAAGLWLDTARRPGAPLDLLHNAIQQRHGVGSYLLLAEPAQLVPLARLRPASAATLAAIAARWR